MPSLVQEQKPKRQREVVKKSDYPVESERERMEAVISVKVGMR